MKAKARSLFAHQERKSKVALNCIIRAVLYKDRVSICGMLFIAKGSRYVSISGETTKQI